MAKLTEQLDGINSGQRIIAPADTSGGPSFLGGLSKLASNGAAVFSNNAQTVRQQTSRRIANELETGVTQFRKEATDQLRTGPTPEMDLDGTLADFGIPEDVRREAVQLDRQRRAVEQGRAVQSALDVKLENFVSSMQAKYPEYTAEIGKYMTDRGFDHYLWREQKLQDAAQVAGEQAQVSGYAGVIKSAVEAGYGNLGLTNDQLYQQGVRLAEAAAQAEAAKALAAETRAAAQEGRADAEFVRKERDRALTSAATAQLNASLGGITSHVDNLIKAADGDESVYQRVIGTQDEVMALFDKVGLSLIQNLQAEGADASTITALQETIETRKKAVQDLYFGSSSRFAQRNRAYEDMQRTFGLQAEQAMPFYMWAKRTMGAAYVEAIFGGDMSTALSPELTEKIKQDLANWDPTRPNTGLNMLAEIGALAKGHASLADIPEAAITGDHIKALSGTARRAREMIEDPEPDDVTEKQSFLGSVGNLSIAALRIQPGNKDLAALDYALGSIANPGNLRVLNSFMKDEGSRSEALPVFMATRQAAAQILEVARTAVGKVDGQNLTVKNDRYEVEVKNKRSALKLPLSDDAGLGTIPGSQWRSAEVNPELKRQAGILNAAIDYLVNTSAADPNLKGYTPQELRAHYMFGTPLKSKTEGGKPVKADLNAQVDAFELELKRASEEVPSFTNPQAVFDSLVIQESGGRPGVEGPQTPYGVAQGMTQMLPATAEEMANKLGVAWQPELMTGTTKEAADYQLMLGRAYFDEGLEKYGGDMRKALMYYHGGPDEKLWGPKTRKYAEQVLNRVNKG